MSDPPCGDFHAEDSGASLVPQLSEKPGQVPATGYAAVNRAFRDAKREHATLREVVGDADPSLVPLRLRPLPISRAMAHAGARVLRGFTGDEFNAVIKVFSAMDAVRREEEAG